MKVLFWFRLSVLWLIQNSLASISQHIPQAYIWLLGLMEAFQLYSEGQNTPYHQCLHFSNRLAITVLSPYKFLGNNIMSCSIVPKNLVCENGGYPGSQRSTTIRNLMVASSGVWPIFCIPYLFNIKVEVLTECQLFPSWPNSFWDFLIKLCLESIFGRLLVHLQCFYHPLLTVHPIGDTVRLMEEINSGHFLQKWFSDF